MAKAKEANSNTSDREILATRLVNAPRELVYEVWTDPKHIVQWWGPNGFTNTIKEMEVKPGGVWRFTMHGPDGVDYPNKIVYNEVVKPEKLSFTHSDDNDENFFVVTVTFESQGQKTLITMRMVFATPEERDRVVNEYGALEGNKQTMDKLEAYLAKQQQYN